MFETEEVWTLPEQEDTDVTLQILCFKADISSVQPAGVTVKCSCSGLLGRVWRRRVAAGFCFFLFLFVVVVVAQEEQWEHPQDAADGDSDGFTLQERKKMIFLTNLLKCWYYRALQRSCSWIKVACQTAVTQRRRAHCEACFAWTARYRYNVFFQVNVSQLPVLRPFKLLSPDAQIWSLTTFCRLRTPILLLVSSFTSFPVIKCLHCGRLSFLLHFLTRLCLTAAFQPIYFRFGSHWTLRNLW